MEFKPNFGQLELRYEDGRTEMICSDESWQWSDDGPIRFADNKDGETVVAFQSPTYNRRAAVTRHSVVPVASNNVPVIEHERFHPTVSVAPNGRRLYDFGQILRAGWSSGCRRTGGSGSGSAVGRCWMRTAI